ncbi:unnamed protein product [Phyllotreta striolata]|uniref:Uncharacterized protein n=1 Tax=Phyllotreta striolata TaxID=444603 RepID=A0A9N9XPC1_PHYSR|nr:unnamed protein product [Phyllotreta striolata]
MTKNTLTGLRLSSFGVLFKMALIFSVLKHGSCIKVSIFYEGLCYDSVKFIGQQLYPNWNSIKSHITVEFVPYGKAIHTSFGDNGYKFMCHHGAAECLANKYQSCLLKQNMDDTKNVELIYCIMSSNKPGAFDTARNCASELGYDLTKFTKCVNSKEADEYLAENGNKTWAVVPNISFVPTIVFDDIFERSLQAQALTDFIGVVCDRIIDITPPKICERKPKDKVSV